MWKETRVIRIKVDVLSGVKILYGYSYNNQISWWIRSNTQIFNCNLHKALCQHIYTTARNEHYRSHERDTRLRLRHLVESGGGFGSVLK